VMWNLLMRVLGPLYLVGFAAAISCPVQAQTAHTTRIERRPMYDATVTIEHGVRVYRPIPPTEHLIVNPDRVPLLLEITPRR